MDIISHGLWGGVLGGRKSRRQFAWAVFFGTLPDLASFGIFSLLTFFGLGEKTDWSSGPPAMEAIPDYVHALYNISHSLVIFLVVAVLMYLFIRDLFIPFLAYGFAVALDIPTHGTDFFATPFLWPLFDYKFDGIPWSEPYIFFPNLLLLLIAYMVWYLHKRKNQKA